MSIRIQPAVYLARADSGLASVSIVETYGGERGGHPVILDGEGVAHYGPARIEIDDDAVEVRIECERVRVDCRDADTLARLELGLEIAVAVMAQAVASSNPNAAAVEPIANSDVFNVDPGETDEQLARHERVFDAASELLELRPAN